MLRSAKYNNGIFHSFAIVLLFQCIKMLLKWQTSLWKYSHIGFSNTTKYLVIAVCLPGVLWSLLNWGLNCHYLRDEIIYHSWAFNWIPVCLEEKMLANSESFVISSTHNYSYKYSLCMVCFILLAVHYPQFVFFYIPVWKTQSSSQVPEVTVCDFCDHSPTISNIYRNLHNQSKQSMNNVQTKFVYMSYSMSIYELEIHL